MNNQPLSSLILAWLIALLVGIAYNFAIGKLNASGKSEGYTALLVVGGVAITLIFAAFFISGQDALIVTAFFIATGLPMIFGDIARYIKRREQGRKLLKD